jgi:hypothetical protein
MSTASDVTREALLLPEEARATLAEVLLDSLSHDEGERDTGMEAVLEERSRAIREGRATFHEPGEIFEEYERMKAERRAAQAS